MSDASEYLWWLNNAYCSRLARAENSLALLEYLLDERAQAGDAFIATLLPLLDDLRRQILWLTNEHRDWRHTYYYQSRVHKRMVVAESDVHRALVHFRRMRARHERVFAEALSAFAGLPRPGSTLTRVALADLWLHVELALDDLARFIDAASHVDSPA